MNKVQFNEEQGLQYTAGPRGLEGLVISLGLAKDKRGAQIILLSVMIIAICVGIFFLFLGGSGPQGLIPEGTSETVSG